MATITNIATLIARSPGICGNRPCINGTRISVQQIAVLHQEGLRPIDILNEYEFLNLAQIYSALAYYYANQSEIEAYLKEDAATYDRLIAEQATE